eukprot:SAG31_NODE_10392_length_1144_cov_0.749282_1_plen_92_part_10
MPPMPQPTRRIARLAAAIGGVDKKPPEAADPPSVTQFLTFEARLATTREQRRSIRSSPPLHTTTAPAATEVDGASPWTTPGHPGFEGRSGLQ